MSQPKNILSVLADNPALMDAVKALLIKQFDMPTNLGPGTSDEVLGQYFRAKMSGTKAIEDAWKELSQYKTVEDKPERVNPAR